MESKTPAFELDSRFRQGLETVFRSLSLRRLTFRQKMAAGFAICLSYSLLIGGVSIHAIRSVAVSSNGVGFDHLTDVIAAKDLMTLAQQNVAISRGFLLTRDQLFIQDLRLVNATFVEQLRELQKRTRAPGDLELLRQIEVTHRKHNASLERALTLRKKKAGVRRVSRYFNDKVMLEFDRLEFVLIKFVKYKKKQLKEARTAALEAYSRAVRIIFFLAISSIALAAGLAAILTRKLSRNYEQTQQALTARDEMLATVSHDLRNPLTAILMGLRVILRKKPTPNEEQKLFSTITQAAERMDRLTLDLLDVAKLDLGQFRINCKAENSYEILEMAARTMEPIAESAGVTIKIESSGSGSGEKVSCDRERILQVFSNLLSNSIKFSPKGSTVVLGADFREKDVVFWVQDSGRGIPAGDLPQIFDRYWHSARKNPTGSGLGLAISKSIVEAHRGRIWAESDEGQGTRVFFAIRAAEFSRTKVDEASTALLVGTHDRRA